MADNPRTRPDDQSGATRLTPPTPPVDDSAPRVVHAEPAPPVRDYDTPPPRMAPPAPPVREYDTPPPRMDVAPAPEPAAAGPSRKEVVSQQRQAFGGIKWGSAFFGWLTAIGLAVPLIALASAAGTAVSLTTSGGDAGQAASSAAQNAATIGLTGGIILLVILMLAYYAGGYVAGRMSRFDGLRQGAAVWVVGLLIILAVSLLAAVAGAQYNIFSSLNLPSIPVSGQTLGRAGLISLLAVLAGTLLASILGGKLGERYHRKIDRVGLDH